MGEHTPTPWSAEQGHSVVTVKGADGARIASVDRSPYWQALTKADENDAAFIVKAVNCHDELVAALEGFRLTEDAIVGAQADCLVLRIPNSAIIAAAAALAKAALA